MFGFEQDMSWGTLGTVRPFSNFHADRDAMEIQSALEKKGTSADLVGKARRALLTSDVG